MSTLKTHNLQSSDSGSVNIALTANAGMIITGISTFSGNVILNSGNLQLGSTSGQDSIIHTTNAAGILYRADENGHKFQTYVGGWQDRLSIIDDGKVGVGRATSLNCIFTAQDNTGSISSSKTVTAEFRREDGTRNPRIQILHNQDGSIIHHTYSTGASNLMFDVGGTEKLRIDSSGRLLLGTTSVGNASAYYDNLIISNTTSGEGSGITLFAATNGFNAVDFADTAAVGRGRITYAHSDDSFRIDTAGQERLRITSGGNFGFSTNNPDTTFRIDCAGSLRLGTGSYGSRLQFSRSGLGDELVIGVDGYGSSFSANDAVIQSSPSFGRPLIFGTNNTERLRIESGGQTKLNITSNSALTEPLLIRNGGTGSGTNVGMVFYNGDESSTGAGAMARITAIDEGSYDSSLQFETGLRSGWGNTTTAHMKLTKDGRLGLGQTNVNSIDSKLFIQTSGTSEADGITFKSGSGSTGAKFYFATTNPDRSKYIQHSGYWLELGCHQNEGIRFRDAVNDVVRFYMNGGAGSYYFTGSNLSDRNLKKNIETITTSSIDLIKQVIPKTFNWKIDDNNTPHGGFIAQEMQPLFPKLVSGTDYDESRTDSPKGCNPTGLAFDYNGYTAYLTKAMQELIAKVESLEAEVASLKSS